MNALVIIEDDLDQLELLRDILSAEYAVPVHAYASAEEYFKNPPPQNAVYVIDWMLPGMTGPQVVKAIRFRDKISSIIMITGNYDPVRVIEGLQIGADDFLFKPVSLDILVTKIGAFLNRKKQLLENALTFGVRFISEAGMVIREGQHALLSEREFQIFKCLYDNLEKTKDRASILTEFKEKNVPERYVDSIVHDLRKKVSPIGFEIESIRGEGYRMLEINNNLEQHQRITWEH